MGNIAAQKSVISKSQYLKGQQCHKALWLYRHRKDIEIPVDEDREQRFTIGHNVGEMAKQYFLGPTSEVRVPFWNVEEGARQTRSFLAEGETLIFEATAIDENQRAYSRIDVLRRHSGQHSGQVDLIEVKSATKVKPYHLEDMAFQYYVFRSAGYSIKACYMMLIDNSYVRQGELELDKLFQLCDISSEVLARQRKVLEQSAELSTLLGCKQEPSIPIGAHCQKPFSCEYLSYCQDLVNQNLTEQEASQMVNGTAGELFNTRGTNNTEGTAAEPMAQPLAQEPSQEPVLQKPKLLESWLEKLQYPLYFLDYESFQSSIPLFDGCRPYQNVPFQFSLHKLEDEGSELEHFAFLHTEQSDPRPALIEALLEHCGQQGSILVYSQSFEKSVHTGLARCFPQHGAALLQLNQRICDMLIPFQKHWIYSPLQQGSASLKAVLPAFSDLSYEGLDIANGLDAMNGYLSFMLGAYNAEQAKELHQALLQYCQQDTMALVVLLRVIRKLLHSK